MMFKKGDKYIHFTKYGGVNKGEVREVGNSIVLDIVNKVNYYKPYIVTNKNFTLYLDGSDGRIYKIESELTDEQCKRHIIIINVLSNRKTELENKYKL